MHTKYIAGVGNDDICRYNVACECQIIYDMNFSINRSNGKNL